MHVGVRDEVAFIRQPRSPSLYIVGSLFWIDRGDLWYFLNFAILKKSSCQRKNLSQLQRLQSVYTCHYRLLGLTKNGQLDRISMPIKHASNQFANLEWGPTVITCARSYGITPYKLLCSSRLIVRWLEGEKVLHQRPTTSLYGRNISLFPPTLISPR